MATLEQIAAALRKADAAGNVEDARALANAYRQMQGQGASAQVNPDAGFDPMRDLPIPGTSHPGVPDKRYSSPIPGGDFMNEMASSFAENIPVIGPLATRAADSTGSQIAAMITGQPAEQMLEQGQDMRARDASDQPLANTVGAVGGSVGPLMALGTTQLGGQALGMTGPLWQRMLAGGASGGLISGADSLARGDTLEEAGGKSLLGLGMGAGFPLAERAMSPVLRALMGDSVPAPVQTLGRNLERDGMDPAAILAQMDQLGPDAMLMDLGPNMTRQAGAIASLPGEGQTVLRDALVARNAGSNARIQSDVNTTLGPSPLPSAVQADIRAGQQALSPEYQQVLQGAQPVDTSAVARNLDSVIQNRVGPEQRAAQQVRAMLDEFENPGVLSADPARLLSARQAIDGMMGDATNNQVISVLSSARREIDELLAQNVPGIKQVDAQFEELARQSEGLQSGQQMLDSGRTAPRPAEVESIMTGGANPQGLFIGPSGEPFRVSQGARAEIDRLVGTTGNNITALKSALKGDGSWNRERLASLFGQGKADDLLNILEREQTYQRAYNTVLTNSETAARTASQKEAAPNQFGSTSTSIADLLLKVPQWAANTAAKGRSESLNEQIARMLISRPTPELVDQLIAARQMNRGLIGSSAVPLLTN